MHGALGRCARPITSVLEAAFRTSRAVVVVAGFKRARSMMVRRGLVLTYFMPASVPGDCLDRGTSIRYESTGALSPGWLSDDRADVKNR